MRHILIFLMLLLSISCTQDTLSPTSPTSFSDSAPSAASTTTPVVPSSVQVAEIRGFKLNPYDSSQLAGASVAIPVQSRNGTIKVQVTIFEIGAHPISVHLMRRDGNTLLSADQSAVNIDVSSMGEATVPLIANASNLSIVIQNRCNYIVSGAATVYFTPDS